MIVAPILHPTKALHNGIACQLSTNGIACQEFWQFCQTMINQHSRSFKKFKKQEPFCKASTSSSTQRQLPFSQGHFVGFSPCNSLSFILFGGGRKLFHATFAAWECRQCFANNVLAILLHMKAFSIGSHKNGPKATKSRAFRRIAMDRGTFLGSVAPFLFSTAAGAPKPASTECAKSTKHVKAIFGGRELLISYSFLSPPLQTQIYTYKIL